MAQTDFQKILAELERLCGGVPSDSARLIDAWLEKHEVHRILEAIERTKERGARSPKYVDQMLIGWEVNGYPPTRTDQVLARAFKPARGGKDPTASILAYIDRLEQCNG